MTRRIIKYLSILYLLISCSTVVGQEIDSARMERESYYDSAEVVPRHFDPGKINEFQSDSDFDYGYQPRDSDLSLWDRFWRWVSRIFRGLYELSTGTSWGRIFTWIIFISIIAFVIFKLLKVDINRVFYGQTDKGKLDMSVVEENIHEMDFDTLIDQALEKRHYRMAIRLNYLYALKHLTDHHLVEWAPGKTNYEYVSELKKGDLRTNFGELSFYFDYAWYGDFKVDKPMYRQVRELFNGLRSSLGNEGKEI